MSGDASVEYPLSRHVPRLALDWVVDEPERRWQLVEGSMVFADISGFTALAERLATRGRIGAEELVETLSNVFGAMLGTAASRGGQLLKFGGDALLFLFTGDDHVRQACSTAVEMRAELRRASQTRTSVGRLDLRISTGVHTGEFHMFLVGEPHRELVVLGPATTTAVACEHDAEAGQIVVSPEVAARLPIDAVRTRDDGRLLLRWRTAPVPRTGPLPGRDTDVVAARALMPRLLGTVLDGSRPDPAHRVATVAFLRFSGTDEILEREGPEVLADQLHRMLGIVQHAFVAEDVALLCVDSDMGAGKIFCSSGVPLTSEDDEGRMLRAVAAILAADPPLPLQVGVNRGHVFAAEVGHPDRAAFSAMGDTTNTAARICGRAPAGRIYVHPSVLDHTRSLYDSEPVGPFQFKGKAQPQVLYDIGAELGTRQAVDLDELELLGREAERAGLEEALTAVRRPGAARGSVVVVHGAVGVGKSRLVADALRPVAERTSVPVLTVRAEPYGSTSAYRVFRDPVRAMLGVQRGDPAAMVETAREEVRRVAPHLEPFLALIGDVIQLDVPITSDVRSILPQYRAERTADVIVELLAAVHAGPLVVTVEDAHWVDGPSSVLLARIASETAARPWTLLVARRDAATGFDPPDARRIELRPLPDDVVQRLAVAATVAAPLRPHELEQMVERAGGNPLFLLELVRAAQELGSLDAVPTSLQGAMAAQVDALDPLSRRVLAYASVLGRSFRRVALLQVLRAEQVRVDDATLERLQRFLEEDGPERFRFRNGLVRDVTYDGLGYHLRARMHAQAGAALERISTDPGADASVLALHFSQAGDHDRTYRFGVMAAERAARAHANIEAGVQYERAIDAARRLPEVPARQIRFLWTALGESRERAGLFERALDAYERALGVAEPDPTERAELLLRRAATRERMGRFSLALRESTRARSALLRSVDPEAERLRARATAFAALVRQRQVRLVEAVRLAERAITEAERSGEMSALAGAYRVISVATYYQGDPGAASYCERAYELYERLGDLSGQADMAFNLGAFAYFDGRWADTLERYQQAAAASRRLGDHVEAASIDANTAEVLISQRRLLEAEETLRQAIRVLRASGSPWLANFAEMQLGRALTALGRPSEAEPVLRNLVTEAYQMGVPATAYEVSLHLADCLVAQGRGAEALSAIDQATARNTEDMSLFEGAESFVRAMALHSLGRTGDAAALVRRGVAATRQRKLEFDLARLLALAGEIGVADEVSEDLVGELASIRSRLGIDGAA